METDLLKWDERQTLAKYRVCFQETDPSPLSIPVEHLFDQSRLKDCLLHVQQALQADNVLVSASMFAKRYSYLIIVPALYSFSYLNKSINIATDNLYLRSSERTDNWLPEIYLCDQRVVLAAKNRREREQQRQELFKQIFAGHLNRLWSQLASITKISKQVLWENAATYLFWLYDSLLQKELADGVRQRISSDFNYILHAEASFFGEDHHNPIARFYSPKAMVDGQEFRVRKTCCLSDKSAQRRMCKGCPRSCS